MSVTSHGPPVGVWLNSVVSPMAKTGFVTATPCRRCSTVMLLLPRMTSRFFFRVVVRPDTICANCRHKLLCHFKELLVIAVCKRAAIIITQVVDTAPYLHDGYCTIRVTAALPLAAI